MVEQRYRYLNGPEGFCFLIEYLILHYRMDQFTRRVGFEQIYTV